MTRVTLLPALPCILILASAFAAGKGFVGSRSECAALVPQPKAQDKPALYYYSSNTCAAAGCHNQANPFDGNGLQPICRCGEMRIWDEEDKHKIAHKVLLDSRARQMGVLLAIEEVATDKRCVSCHGVWIEPGDRDKADDEIKEKDLKKRVRQGVTCVVCHGPYEEWIDRHYTAVPKKRKDWRDKTRVEKETKFGMTDLWDPAKRVRLCASCHIGDADQGKVVTHEMYAAGHPPLPGFEVVTFSNQMPRHWQYLKEKDDSILKLLDFNQRQAELEETHLLAIGGLIAFQENLKLLQAQAATKGWPELAHFDCYACHHELKSKSWRQERGFAGKPGRPPLREWPTALVELGLFHAAEDPDKAAQASAQFQAHLAQLQACFDAQPFGDPKSVQEKAEKLRHWIEGQVKQIQKRIELGDKEAGYGINASAKLFAHLLDLQQRSHPNAKVKRPAPDFDSARQLAWAYQVLYLETASKHDPKLRKKLAGTLHTHAAWKGLDDYLRLTLPEGQKPLEASLSLGLERTGQYEPREYFKHLDAALKQFNVPK